MKCKLCGHPRNTDEHAGISHLPFTKAHKFEPTEDLELFGDASESAQERRQIVDAYETRHAHLRGHYTRTDLLAIVRQAMKKR